MNEPLELSRERAAESGFFSQVYLWMAAGLGFTAGVSYLTLTIPALWRVTMNPAFWLIAFFGLLGISLWVNRSIERMSVGAAVAGFAGYSGLLGMWLAPIFVVYTGASIAWTFAVAAGTFLFFSLYGFTTRANLLSMGGFLVMGLWGVILASFVNFFLIKSAGFDMLLTYAGIAVILGLIAFQTQALRAIYQTGFASPQMRSKMAIVAALALYASFINLFLWLLRLFGRRHD